MDNATHEPTDNPGWVYGVHAVEAALTRDADRVSRLVVVAGHEGAAVGRLTARARKGRVRCDQVPRNRLDQLCGSRAHQGVAAQVAPFAYATLDEIIARGAADPPGLVVILDGVADPHNLGAVIRTAEAAGAHGLVIPKQRAAPLTEVAAKVSAGASFHLPVARVANVAQTVLALGDAGYMSYALDADAPTALADADLRGPVVLVMGGEEKGVRPLVIRRCDATLRIPLRGQTPSLNVSAAAAVAIFAVIAARSNP